jgi:hypothetical protein
MVLQLRREKRQEKRNQEKEPLEDYQSAIQASKEAAGALESYSREINSLRQELAAVRLDVIRRDEIIAARDRDLQHKTEYIQVLLRGIERLVAQVRSLDQVPVWTPVPLEEHK